MRLADLSLGDFGAELASGSPAPGGGSAAALVGNLGAALAGMVAELTIGKKAYAGSEALMRGVRSEAEARRYALLELVDRDAEAFRSLREASAMPKNTDGQRWARTGARLDAKRRCVEAPLKVMEHSLAMLRQIESALGGFNPNAASDVGVAALCLKAAAQGAWMNVLINTGGAGGDGWPGLPGEAGAARPAPTPTASGAAPAGRAGQAGESGQAAGAGAPADEHACELAGDSACAPAGAPANEYAGEPACELASDPVYSPADKSAGELAGAPVGASICAPADESASDPACASASAPADEYAGEPACELASDPACSPADKSAGELASAPVGARICAPADESASDSACAPASAPARAPAANPAADAWRAFELQARERGRRLLGEALRLADRICEAAMGEKGGARSRRGAQPQRRAATGMRSHDG